MRTFGICCHHGFIYKWGLGAHALPATPSFLHEATNKPNYKTSHKWQAQVCPHFLVTENRRFGGEPDSLPLDAVDKRRLSVSLDSSSPSLAASLWGSVDARRTGNKSALLSLSSDESRSAALGLGFVFLLLLLLTTGASSSDESRPAGVCRKHGITYREGRRLHVERTAQYAQRTMCRTQRTRQARPRQGKRNTQIPESRRPRLVSGSAGVSSVSGSVRGRLALLLLDRNSSIWALDVVPMLCLGSHELSVSSQLHPYRCQSMYTRVR